MLAALNRPVLRVIERRSFVNCRVNRKRLVVLVVASWISIHGSAKNFRSNTLITNKAVCPAVTL
jgi:acetolactate synthase regulatory subunit